MNWRTIIVSAIITTIIIVAAMTIFIFAFGVFAPVALAPILKTPTGTRGVLFLASMVLIFAIPVLINAGIIFLKNEQKKFLQALMAASLTLVLSSTALVLIGCLLYLLRAFIRTINPSTGPG